MKIINSKILQGKAHKAPLQTLRPSIARTEVEALQILIERVKGK